MAWTCAFCGLATSRRTREHLLREAWAPHFPDAPWVGMTRTVGDADPTTNILPNNAFDFPIRDVCEDCNRGWMNQLDTDAEPLVIPLALGQRTHVNAAESRLLARWIAKTALVRTLHDRAARRLTPLLRAMESADAAPEGVIVLAGLTSDLLLYPAGRHTWGSTRDAAPGVSLDANLRTVCLTIQHFAFYVAMTDDPTAADEVVEIASTSRRIAGGKWTLLPVTTRSELLVLTGLEIHLSASALMNS